MTWPWMERLSLASARRVALAAQGFADQRTADRPDRRHLRRAFARIGMVQIDSVNVLVRSHFLPLFSRLGPYPAHSLTRLAEHHRELFEYWGHEASLLPVEYHPLLRWRMARASREAWSFMAALAREKPGFVAAVLAEVRARGPLAASELENGGDRPFRGMWGRTEGKNALEWLFWNGQLTSAGRRPSFERIYDLPERVLPAAVLGAPTPEEHEAQRCLLGRAARALGIASARDLADYFRIKIKEARPRLAELVETGELVPAAVEGWQESAFLHRDAPMPERLRACALLSPFDSLVWERSRTERLFGMRLRLEIYTPAQRRVHGYYVLPFLLGETLMARVDLKADRATGTLQVLGAFAEGTGRKEPVAAALWRELLCLAGWLGLSHVAIGKRGDLSALLARRARPQVPDPA